ncbi:S1C family serine protease [Cytobacillus sp. FJAT-54145]|uniref:S1C family serine protease n=1 Tax=Cytobacillus spartinae TaxID=3299023 RepID=A0ABW6KCP7_9BACI
MNKPALLFALSALLLTSTTIFSSTQHIRSLENDLQEVTHDLGQATHQLEALEQKEETVKKAVQSVSFSVGAILTYDKDGNKNGSGSGFLIDAKEGYIVTNAHVVKEVDKMELLTPKGEKIPVSLVGKDVFSDLAVLKGNPDQLSKQDMKPLAIKEESSVEVGDTVFVVGSPLDENFASTITKGMVSAINRILPMEDWHGIKYWEQSLIQTDAPINPGNSGGVLVNEQGVLVGVPSSKIDNPIVEGMGFAIPMNETVKIVSGIIEQKGDFVRPSLGIGVIPISQFEGETPFELSEGLYVENVESRSKASLQKGDVILKFDGKEVNNLLDLRKVLFEKEVGNAVELTVIREGKPKKMKATLVPLQTSPE